MASQSEQETAQFLGDAVEQYGPLTRDNVRGYADHASKSGNGRLSHGLAAVAAEMKSGEVVKGRAADKPAGFFGNRKGRR